MVDPNARLSSAVSAPWGLACLVRFAFTHENRAGDRAEKMTALTRDWPYLSQFPVLLGRVGAPRADNQAPPSSILNAMKST